MLLAACQLVGSLIGTACSSVALVPPRAAEVRRGGGGTVTRLAAAVRMCDREMASKQLSAGSRGLSTGRQPDDVSAIARRGGGTWAPVAAYITSYENSHGSHRRFD